MPEYSGSLQSFELAVLLWLVPLLPLAAAVYAKTFGARLARDTERKSENKALEPTLVCLALALACTAILALSTADLAFASAGRRQLLSHAWNLVRIGSLDANLMLCLDPATAIASLGVTLGAVFALYWCRTSELAEDARRSLSAAVSFGLAGIQLVLLGDDWVLVLAGALIAALSTLGLVGRGARGFVLARVGDAAIVLGAVVLTWGLGGSFTGARDYVPAYRAPLIAAQVGSPTSKEAARERPGSGTGFLSMAAFPGAELSMGGAALCRIDADGKPGGVGLPGRACREAARPPFAQLELPTGLQDVLVNPGPGQSELLVDKLRVNAGRETLIMPSGATISLREGRNQLRVEDPSGERVLAGELGKWRLLGIPIFALVSGLFLFGAAWRGLVVPLARSGSEPAESSLAAAVIVAALADFVVGAAILLRVGFVFEFAPRVSSVAAGVLARSLSSPSARLAMR